MRVYALCFALQVLLLIGLLALYARPILHVAHILNHPAP
jgi:hypothetical protein